MHVIARNLEASERLLTPQNCSATTPYSHSTRDGNFSIECVLQVFSQLGSDGSWPPRFDGSSVHSLLIASHQHYWAILKITGEWWVYDSLSPKSQILNLDNYLLQFLHDSLSSVVWFVPEMANVGTSSIAMHLQPPSPSDASLHAQQLRTHFIKRDQGSRRRLWMAMTLADRRQLFPLLPS